MSGQSIMDRVQAARHSIAGQGLAKSVCKATTEEIIGPKKKHLDYLIQCTNEPNVSIPQLADLLIERTQHTNWIVVFKSLITIHNMMNYGNERLTQYLASNNCTFQLGNFIDKAGMQGYDMSTFIRRYAKYLNEKAASYRTMAFDFCKVKRGKDDGLLRTMNADKLLKTLPVLQQQLNALLEFDCTPNELTNGVINACFMLLFKDLIRLFACYNDGIINLLEKYFDMNKKQCKESLDIYKKFLVSMDKVSEFLKVAENVGIDRGDIPDLAKAPASLLDALEQHLQQLEGKKVGATTPTGTAKPAGFSTALNTITNNSNAFDVSEEEKKRILDEENRRLQQLKEQRIKELQTSTTTSPTQTAPTQTNPFAYPAPAVTTSTTAKGSNLFTPASPNDNNTLTNGTKPSDDLLGLAENPFQQNIENVMATAYTTSNNPFVSNTNTAWNTTGTNFSSDEVDFSKAFDNANSTPAAGLDLSPSPGAVMHPSVLSTAQAGSEVASSTQGTESTSESASGGVGTSSVGGSEQEPVPAEHTQAPVVADLMGEPVPQSDRSSTPSGSDLMSANMGRITPVPSEHSQPPGGADFLSGSIGRVTPVSDHSLPPVGSEFMSANFGRATPDYTLASGGSDFMSGGGLGFGGGVAGMQDPTAHMGSDFMSGVHGSAGGMAQVAPMIGMAQGPPMGYAMGAPGMGTTGMGGLGMGAPGMGAPGMGVPGMTGGSLTASPRHAPSQAVASGGPPKPFDFGVEEASKALGLNVCESPKLSPRSPRRAMSPAANRRSASPSQGAMADPGSSGFDAFGEVLQPANARLTASQAQQNQDTSKLLDKDINTSLTKIAGNLHIGGPANQVKKAEHNWQPKGEQKLTGGQNWQPPPAVGATLWGQQPQYAPQPMVAPMGMAPRMGYPQPVGVPMVQPMAQPAMMGMPGVRPMGMVGQPAMYGAVQQPVGFQQPAPPITQTSNKPNDPFGAL